MRLNMERMEEELAGIPLPLRGLLMQDEINRDMGITIPDTSGADEVFLEGFLSREMSYDFGLIGADFLKHHFGELEEYNRLAPHEDNRADLSNRQRSLHIRILRLIYQAAKTGDTYSVELIKYLYKTYHKKEYNQLKRFSRITPDELFSLSEGNMGGNYDSLARLLGMCQFYGIKLDEKCSVIYLILSKKKAQWDQEDELHFFEFPEGLYKECSEQVKEWTQGKRENERETLYWKRRKFVDLCLKYNGYPAEYGDMHKGNVWMTECLMTETLALLRSAFPKENFSYEDVQLYAHICEWIDLYTRDIDDYVNEVLSLLGISDEDQELLEGESLFRPEMITYKENSQPKIKEVPIVKEEKKGASDYEEEILELRCRLREKEEQCKHFKAQYDQANRTLKEYKILMECYEDDREELIALRNHVYHLSENMPEVEENHLDNMKRSIAKRRIAIIGGHINWVNKLKREFPAWKYLDAEIVRSNESVALDGIEKVYFFSEHLSHGTYGRCIARVRQQKIPFGYIHTVNLDTVVKQIYVELQEAGL